MSMAPKPKRSNAAKVTYPYKFNVDFCNIGGIHANLNEQSPSSRDSETEPTFIIISIPDNTSYLNYS